MKISKFLINKLGEYIIGDSDKIVFPYLKGAALVEVYNSYCEEPHTYPEDMYDKDLQVTLSRKKYSQYRLNQLNDSNELRSFLIQILSISHFMEYGCEESHEKTITYLNKLFKKEEYKIEVDEEGNTSIIGGVIVDDPISVELYFNEIKREIINEIKKAKATIWIAMAWFTDRDIIGEVFKKQREGLDVKIIVFDEENNVKYGILHSSKSEHFKQLFKVTYNEESRKKMHNKFCIIDMKVLMHGSFNYSQNANSNDETHMKIVSYEDALKASIEFLQLLKKATYV